VSSQRRKAMKNSRSIVLLRKRNTGEAPPSGILPGGVKVKSNNLLHIPKEATAGSAGTRRLKGLQD
jgi:hypothetical protein